MYDSYVSVNKKFKSSVNLQYDLYNEEKILQYIPTTDLCDVLKMYIKSILNDSCRATFLAGPYGKGKSYLMLMLSYLISKKKNKKTFEKVISKIKTIDIELYNLLVEIENKNMHLLPVIISNNSFDDFNQNFMLSLRNALIEHNIEDIIPSTAYSEALNLLDRWEDNITNNFDILKKCLKVLKINFETLKNGLKNYELDYYKMFENLYECVTHGCKFNPLASNDISTVYSDVAFKLNNYGYCGLFVIFDEFGVFLENQTTDFANRLNKIQSFAEKASSTTNIGQMHLCCITHKDISLYCKDKNQLSEFEKISGRFKNLRFDRSLDENYQIICSAIEKGIGYNDLVKQSLENDKPFLEKIFETDIFSSINQLNYIYRNGYPFNPISLYALIQISEKVAQNERTLFTFISDVDVSSFNYFIHNNNEGLLNVPVIYDYFESLIKDNEEYKMLYYKVEAMKRLSIKEGEHNIFKVIAIMKIVNDSIKFNASLKNIALCLHQEEKDIKKIIDKLIEKNILKANINDNSIDFAVLAGKEINELLDSIIVKQYADISLSEMLSNINSDKYYVSNRYNFEKCMTRFFRLEYLEASKLTQLNSIDSLFEKEYCDGLVVNLINDINLKETEVISLVKKFDKSNLIIRFIKKDIPKDAREKIKKIAAAKYVIKNDSNISETVKNSLPILVDDLNYEILKYLDQLYYESNCIWINDYKSINIKDVIYNSLNATYPETIILNNEQVNKNVISSTTLKSRNTVIDDILLNKQTDFGTTSAEATIKLSFEDSVANYPEFIDKIKQIFLLSGEEGVNATLLVKNLHDSPVGMRYGIIPLFIAKAISDLSIKDEKNLTTVLLYNDTKEIELNSLNLVKALSFNSSKYRFVYAQINKDKLFMTNKLLEVFHCPSDLSFNDSITCLIKAIKMKISNLSPAILKSTVNDNILKLSNNAIKFKDLFVKHDLNNYNVLFKDLPKIFNCDYIRIPEQIEEIFSEYNIKIEELVQNAIKKVKLLFGNETDTINSSINIWKMEFPQIDNIIFDDANKKIYQAINKMQYNDNDSIKNLSLSILLCSIEEWTIEKEKKFYEALYNFKSYVENFDFKSNAKKDDFSNANDNLTSLGKTLYTNLLDSIEEYGSSLSNEEKAKVLKKLLFEILN